MILAPRVRKTVESYEEAIWRDLGPFAYGSSWAKESVKRGLKKDPKLKRKESKAKAKALNAAAQAKKVKPAKTKKVKPVKKFAKTKKHTTTLMKKSSSLGSLSRSSSTVGLPFNSRLALARNADINMNNADANRARQLAEEGSMTHVWQFKENNGRFVNYAPKASVLVEEAYSRWLVNPEVDVRAVRSGDWEYMVDFNNMQQQNVQHPAHTIRQVKRVPI